VTVSRVQFNPPGTDTSAPSAIAPTFAEPTAAVACQITRARKTFAVALEWRTYRDTVQTCPGVTAWKVVAVEFTMNPESAVAVDAVVQVFRRAVVTSAVGPDVAVR
jgi:hypothetical protein